VGWLSFAILDYFTEVRKNKNFDKDSPITDLQMLVLLAPGNIS
jgi:hypothetical protein